MDKNSICFVISPFGEPFDTYYLRVIKPVLDEQGLYAMRGDSLYRPTTIMDDIWSGIKDAKILIAELTGRNPNVFYELGLAHALSKPVILLSQSIDDVPFDLRGIRIILYDKNHPEWGAKLKGDLSLAIVEVSKNPLAAIPTTFKTVVHSKAPEERESVAHLQRIEQQLQAVIAKMQLQVPEPAQPQSGGEATFKVNDTVVHPKFGRGRVVAEDGKGDYHRLQVNFDTQGLKWLMAKYANMTKVDTR